MKRAKRKKVIKDHLFYQLPLKVQRFINSGKVKYWISLKKFKERKDEGSRRNT